MYKKKLAHELFSSLNKMKFKKTSKNDFFSRKIKSIQKFREKLNMHIHANKKPNILRIISRWKAWFKFTKTLI
jgi:hypothetical protein